jgi:hypothetical protein
MSKHDDCLTRAAEFEALAARVENEEMRDTYISLAQSYRKLRRS